MLNKEQFEDIMTIVLDNITKNNETASNYLAQKQLAKQYREANDVVHARESLSGDEMNAHYLSVANMLNFMYDFESCKAQLLLQFLN